MNNIYLNKYIEKRSINHFGETHRNIKDKKFNFFIVIPCYNELNYIFETLKSINEQNQKLLNETLVIVVINNSKDEKESVKNNNQKTYQKLIEKKYTYNFIAIDAFSIDNAIPNKLAGVGYARKIGLDFALNYILNEQSILCSLDADTVLDKHSLKNIVKPFIEKTNVIAVGGTIKILNGCKITNGNLHERNPSFELCLISVSLCSALHVVSTNWS